MHSFALEACERNIQRVFEQGFQGAKAEVMSECIYLWVCKISNHKTSTKTGETE